MPELISELTTKSVDLVKKQVELAQVELRADAKKELQAAMGFGVAAASGLATFIVLLMAAVLALAEEMPGWQAALVVAGVVLVAGAIASAVGWAKLVKRPLAATQRTLKEDAHWAKERLT